MKPELNHHVDPNSPSPRQATADLLRLGQQLRAPVRGLPRSGEDRVARIARIRQAIADGTYKVDSAAVTKAIIRRQQP